MCVCVCVCVCVSRLNLLLQGSRATRYVFFTMNARFNMYGVRKGRKLGREIPFTAILGHICGDGEHKQVDLE